MELYEPLYYQPPKLDIEAQHPEVEMEPVKEKTSLFSYLYRVVCLWFITMAVGSSIVSIPISAIGLPFVIIGGLWAFFITWIIKIVVDIWKSWMFLAFKSIKSILYSPKYLIDMVSSTFKNLFKVTKVPKIQHKPPSPITPTPSFNVVFKQLESGRLVQLCQELYFSITHYTNSVRVGECQDGKHFVLSLWNEPIHDDLELSHLIGFVEYIQPSSGRILIEKLIISPAYAESGYSKRLIRKLQHSGFTCISVWSLWSTEKFYKGMGFKDVHKHQKRITGEMGPLLLWTPQDKQLRNQSSLVSLVGSGAYNKAVT